MTITARFFATLREGRGKEQELSVADDATPRTVAGQLSIPESDIAILLVNGRDSPLDARLSPGDRVSFFPPVGGG